MESTCGAIACEKLARQGGLDPYQEGLDPSRKTERESRPGPARRPGGRHSGVPLIEGLSTTCCVVPTDNRLAPDLIVTWYNPGVGPPLSD
jgi:hypothetical protein